MTLVTEDIMPVEFADVVASSVHDMKNSIGILLNSAETIESLMPEGTAAREQALLLQHEARRINYDLMHLLGLFKFERSRQAVNPVVVDCVEFLEEIAASNQSLLNSRGIDFVTECIDASEGYFDRDLILGILNSTINNTFKYANERVVVTCRVLEGFTVFTVMDDGPGYGPKILSSHGVNVGRSDYATGSTGLGFYFARRIADMHNHRGRRGRVVLSNNGVNGGGCFALWLP